MLSRTLIISICAVSLAGCFATDIHTSHVPDVIPEPDLPLEQPPVLTPPTFVETTPTEVFKEDNLVLIDEVFTNEGPGGMHEFTESSAGVSQIQGILNQEVRVLPNMGGPRYFAYKLGKGKGLVAGRPYVLSIEYPEDVSRTIWVLNRGARQNRGFHTGSTLSDSARGKYVHAHLESLNLPLSNGFKTFRTYFHLFQRTPGLTLSRDNDPHPNQPEDGFWVMIAQPTEDDQPGSSGAAVRRIAVYEVKDETKEFLPINYPPQDLPRRYTYFRGEMYDDAIDGDTPATSDDAFYLSVAKRMRVLGMNTLGKDLLEFGHNQGWVSDPSGSSNWYNQPSHTDRWEMIVETAKAQGLSVIPYFEYSGAIGQDINQALGSQQRCEPLRGANADYTNVPWVEGANVDLTDPDFIVEAKRVLDKTIGQFKDRVHFVGAWFRTRPAAWPISFSDAARARFAAEANGGVGVSRNDLMNDPALKNRYTDWWFGKRRAFLKALADHMKATVHPDMAVMLTTDHKEGAYGLGHGAFIGTDQPMLWQGRNTGLSIVDLTQALMNGTYLNTVKDWVPTFGEWEWNHAAPPADPENYALENGAMIAYPLGRNFTATSQSAFNAYRTQKGVATVKNYYLNENEMEDVGGYFVGDMDAAGQYTMMTEALAMANGDPRYLGYLSSHDYNRGFPEVVRAFNAAFLSLPALPSRIVDTVTDHPSIVVRQIDTPESGTYYAMVNIGRMALESVDLTFRDGELTNAATGRTLETPDGKIKTRFAPYELKAFHVN